MDEAAYRAHVVAKGYGEPAFREQPADKFVARHTHDFGACLFFLEGQFTIETDEGPVTCGPGDMYEIAPNVPHTELSGPTGAKYLAAKKAV